MNKKELREKKRQARIRIMDVQDKYCKECKAVPKNAHGTCNVAAFEFCDTQCEHGKEIVRMRNILNLRLNTGGAIAMAEEVKKRGSAAKLDWAVELPKMVEQNQNGTPWTVIAKEYGISDSSIHFHLSKFRNAEVIKADVEVSKQVKQEVKAPVAVANVEFEELKVQLTQVIAERDELSSKCKQVHLQLLDQEEAHLTKMEDLSKQLAYERHLNDGFCKTMDAISSEKEELQAALKSQDETYKALLKKYMSVSQALQAVLQDEMQ